MKLSLLKCHTVCVQTAVQTVHKIVFGVPVKCGLF